MQVFPRIFCISWLMIFYWRLHDCKFPQVSMTVSSIIVDLNSIVCIVLARPPISDFSILVTKPLRVVPGTPNTVTITLHSIFSIFWQAINFNLFVIFFAFPTVVRHNGKIDYSASFHVIFFFFLLLLLFLTRFFLLRAILNKSWQQHPTRHQLYGHLPPITKTIQVRRTRHAGHCWRSRYELIRDELLWIPTHGRAKAGRPARTYIQQLCEDTGCCPEDLPKGWMIGRRGERGSGISVLPARYDDDDD